MRHSSRKKHLKHVQRCAHIRRMCYFRTAQALEHQSSATDNPNQHQEKPFEFKAEVIEYNE
ncbi:hypothetical protein [Shewanella sp. Isolate11]|uniref:hypothetical protein n=1 Tax=Shewanella sp. Isolate11 TaxID=2908530 RepID=UPI001EFD5E16|nr:hypothetical protein [Shewanella sp. Isolate11]MCG9696136.1 hypothetical protein [Shewanella sp. Isolate11]